MQQMFAEETPWHTPWMKRVLPQVTDLVARDPSRTVFTRFIPVRRSEQAAGSWRRYYERWAEMTLDALGEDAIQLVPELARFAPPAGVLDKRVFSPWFRTGLHQALRRQGVETLIISGAETDVCVLAAVLGAVDYGYTVVIADDAVCSSADATHDALLELYRNRFGQHLTIASTREILSLWN